MAKSLAGYFRKPCPTELGRFIREHRLRLSLSQGRVDRLSQLPRGACAQFEEGDPHRRYLTPQQQQRLAATINCSLDELRQLSAQPIIKRGALGELLYQQRNILGWSIQDVARRASLSEVCVRKLEGNMCSQMRVVTAQKLAATLRLDYALFEPHIYQDKPLGYREKPTTSLFGNIVRIRRKRLGLSMKRLAKMVDCTHQLISLIELGGVRSSQNKATVRLLEVALQFEVGELKKLMPPREMREKHFNKPRPRSTELGQRLTVWRQTNNLKQSEAANQFGISLEKYSSLERGKILPDSDLQKKIATLLAPALSTA